MKKRIQILVVALALMLSLEARTQVTYIITNNAVTVTGPVYSVGAVIIPDTINGYPVTSIADQAFGGFYDITSVTIPNGVTNIGYDAFDWCVRMTSVNIPNSVTSIGAQAFLNCESLTDVTIPDSVASIGDSAFYDCYYITSMTIGKGVTNIGDSAFVYCGFLTNITVAPENPEYSSTNGVLFNKAQTTLVAFPQRLGGAYTIPDSVISIGNEAFEYSILTNVTIPNSVINIETNAFAYCQGLANVTLPDSVTSLGDEAFYDCSHLLSVTIPDSVASIGNQAFLNCIYLTNINVLPSNPSYSSVNGVLFDKAQTTLIQFPGGSGGTYTIPKSVTNFGSAFAYCNNLTSVIIGNSVTTIEDEAFNYCLYLTSVTIGNSVTSIGDEAFYGCYSMTSVTISSSVTNIGNMAFYACNDLTSAIIPSSVASIGDKAFDECHDLGTVIFLGDAPVLGGDSVFKNDSDPPSGYDTATIYYYSGTTGWGPTYGGLPTVMLNGLSTPPTLGGGGSGGVGVQFGQFGFPITAAVGQTIIVEASTDLLDWQPISTNILSGSSVNFTDSDWTNYPHRFYRTR